MSEYPIKTLGFWVITFRSIKGSVRMLSSPPMQEIIPDIEESEKACIKSSARARGLFAIQSADLRVCGISTTVTPNFSDNAFFPASYLCGIVPAPPHDRDTVAILSPAFRCFGLIRFMMSLYMNKVTQFPIIFQDDGVQYQRRIWHL